MKTYTSNKVTRIFATLLATALGALVLFSAAAAHAEVLSPFKAQYEVERGSITLGTARFSLAPIANQSDCYVYHGVAKPRTIIRFLIGDITDESRFCATGIDDIRTQRFEHTEESDQEDSHELVFDWQAREVIYTGEKAKNGRQTLELPADAVDPFGLHVAARLWLASLNDLSKPAEREFTLVDEDEIKHYRLAIEPGGVIKTPIGSYDTVKLQRVDDPKKKLIFWAAPKLDFMPIRVESKKRDDPVIRMDILSLDR